MPLEATLGTFIDAEARMLNRVADTIGRFTERLAQRQRDEPEATEYALPLPWYAHENSPELELVVEHFRTCWTSFFVRRGTGCLELVFVK